MTEHPPTSEPSGEQLIEALHAVLGRLRASAVETVQRLGQGDAASEQLSLMADLASRSGQLIGQLVARRELLALSSETTLAEAQEWLDNSIQQLQTAQQCARVCLQHLGEQLDEAVREQRGLRAYQAPAAR